jgi:metal-responsive CopG/Arc/MetJ family transcriptional regulator
MKTAISLPDTLYEKAEQTASYMGIPRSQLFAMALKRFKINKRFCDINITDRCN